MNNQVTWASFFEAWAIFRDPILCAALAGAVLGFLSVFIVLRRLVFVSAGVTQSAGLGVALAFFVQIHLGFQFDPLFGAAAMALLATLTVSIDGRRLGLPRESLLGLVFAMAGGTAILISDRISQEAHDIEAILFGSAVLVRHFDLVMVAIIGVVVMIVQLACWRGVLFASFDPDAARVQGLPVRLLNRSLFLCIGAMAGISARALGSLPVFAFSVLPGTAVLLLGLGLPWAFTLATLLGAAAGIIGYLLAFFYQFPVGGSQTVVAGLFVATALVARIVKDNVLTRLRGPS